MFLVDYCLCCLRSTAIYFRVVQFDNPSIGAGSSCIIQKGVATKGNAFGSHKYAGKYAMRFELGVDILVGNLVWIQGPYPAGKYTNIKIINKVLRNFLEPGKRVEADEGYRSTVATPTKSYVRGTMRIRQRIGECRGG